MSATSIDKHHAPLRLERGTRLVCATLVLGVITFACAVHAVGAETEKSVLILYSNQRPLPANVAIDDTLRRVVPEAFGHPIEIFSEYLDVEHFNGRDIAEGTADFLRRKYDGRNVAVIVTPGPDALPFVLRYRDRIAPSAPVVHIVVEQNSLRELQVPGDVVGWAVDWDPAPTLALASRLHPHASRLVLVSGASDWDRSWERRMREAVVGLGKPMQVEFLAGLPTPEVLRQLHALTDDAIVFTPGYFVDGSGKVFTPRESAGQMASISGAPVYSPYDTQLGTGIVGGYMVTFEQQAKQAGAIVVSLLSGASPATIPTGVMRNTPILDWRQVRRWGIDESALPPDSALLFREPNVWAKYRWQIIAIAIVLVVQSLLIAGLLIEHRRRRIAEIESRQRFLEMAHMNRSVALGALSASIAHEINQPLGAILNNANAAEMLLKATPPALSDVADILGDIKRDDVRASEVVTRIRGLLRKTGIEVRDLDLNATVQDALKFIVADASVRGVSLRKDLALGFLPVRADNVQIEQVILNLALNAMDAMRDIPVGRRTLIIRTARVSAAEAEVSVADSGPGIPSDALPRIFEAFFTTKPQGMGLGLAISRTIVEAHGGRIWAENIPGGSGMVRFTLPFANRAP